MKWILSLVVLPTLVQSVLFGTYFDDECTQEVVAIQAFSDVCTWSTNQYDGTYSFYLTECSQRSITVVEQKVDSSESFFCKSNQTTNYTVTNKCQKNGLLYTKILDGSQCEGAGTTYNVVAYNVSDCSVGGLPFSVIYNDGNCTGNSFAPNYASWDTRLFGDSDSYFMEVFTSTDGQCKDPLGLFETKGFPSGCIAPVEGFSNTTFVEIWNAFPLNLIAQLLKLSSLNHGIQR
jgi:hypothetical protein